MATQILLIEDDSQIRENVAELLTLQGFRVETATNGREGISQALLQPPDLILCDVMMPEVDGYQVLDVVRSSRSIANLPFIFLTAKTEPADLRRGMVQGADDYLTKPFTLQSLLSSIEGRLQREAQRKAALQAQLDNYRHTLASVSVHEYNTSLAGILGFTALLMDQEQEYDGEETQSMMKMINMCGLRLKRSLDNIQLRDTLHQLTPGQANYAYFTQGSTSITSSLVDSYAQSVAFRLNKTVGYDLEVEAAQLKISEDNLKMCLVELIDNATKFSDATQTVWVSGGAAGDDYCIRVTNKGRHFNEADRTQIGPFRQFDRKTYEQQGFGLGLWIVHTLLELNQGHLEIESPAEGVTTVAIWLPRIEIPVGGEA